MNQLELFPQEIAYRSYSIQQLSDSQKQQISSRFKVGDTVAFEISKNTHISKIKTVWYLFGCKSKQFAEADYSVEGFNRIFHDNELTHI